MCIRDRLRLPHTVCWCTSPSQCNAFGSTYVLQTWKLRVSLPVYIMALQSISGWILFMVFAGVGVMAAPIDWIFQYMGRPRSVITKSEYIGRARGLAQVILGI